jgi:hypothetical protein
MASSFGVKESGEELTPQHTPTASEVQALLGRILESQPFRTSKQCKDLLRYISEHSLSGDDTALRERVIGTAVFGRSPAYNTDEDPVVRTRAADVRKRLAQYYQSVDPAADILRLELRPGSYRIHFHPDHPAGTPAVDSHPIAATTTPHYQPHVPFTPQSNNRSWFTFTPRRLLAFALLLLAFTGIEHWIPQSSWHTPQELFWEPLTSARQPVLIYCGSNAAYIFSARFLAKYRAAHAMPNTGPEFFVDLPPDSSVKAEDIVPVRNTFVSASDTAAVVQLTIQLRDWKKPFILRSGSDLSIGDLRNRPALMVGAFNNPWTIEITKDLPFRFQEGVRIQDRDHPARSWSVSPDSRISPTDDYHSSATDDYALITRVLVSRTGGPAVTVAGISEYGTLAAAEFLADPAKMRELLKTAPPGWQHKNMQAVLHVRVLDYQPVEVNVVTTTYW